MRYPKEIKLPILEHYTIEKAHILTRIEEDPIPLAARVDDFFRRACCNISKNQDYCFYDRLQNGLVSDDMGLNGLEEDDEEEGGRFFGRIRDRLRGHDDDEDPDVLIVDTGARALAREAVEHGRDIIDSDDGFLDAEVEILNRRDVRISDHQRTLGGADFGFMAGEVSPSGLVKPEAVLQDDARHYVGGLPGNGTVYKYSYTHQGVNINCFCAENTVCGCDKTDDPSYFEALQQNNNSSNSNSTTQDTFNINGTVEFGIYKRQVVSAAAATASVKHDRDRAGSYSRNNTDTSNAVRNSAYGFVLLVCALNLL